MEEESLSITEERYAQRKKALLKQQGLKLEQKHDKPWIDEYPTWKTRAMEFQKQQHKASYKNKTFLDPLGIAVYRAFKVGLGFNFDHLSALSEGDEPSPKRLQARFAKSA